LASGINVGRSTEPSTGGEEELPKLRCSVGDCQYWAKENRCAADEVEVRNDYEVNRGPNLEIGEIAGEEAGRTSAKTCCKTYQPGRNKR
jgi:hypothetical protein